LLRAIIFSGTTASVSLSDPTMQHHKLAAQGFEIPLPE
jgi:hypothetical protein